MFLNGLKLPTKEMVESYTMETKPDVHSNDPYELALLDERLNLLEPGIAATVRRRSSVWLPRLSCSSPVWRWSSEVRSSGPRSQSGWCWGLWSPKIRSGISIELITVIQTSNHLKWRQGYPTYPYSVLLITFNIWPVYITELNDFPSTTFLTKFLSINRGMTVFDVNEQSYWWLTWWASDNESSRLWRWSSSLRSRVRISSMA